jgi:predicted RNase H-like HicB family nuclease
MKKKTHQLTAIIERENEMYVASCPELDVVSQGSSVEEAKSNLQEAVELFLESASETEVAGRLHNEIFITRIDVAIGQI